MQKYFINAEKKVSKATLMLIFLSILTLAVLVIPIAKAQESQQTVTVTPTSGPSGTAITVTISGFSLGDTVNINLGANGIGSIAQDTNGSESQLFYVPAGMYPDAYTLIAQDTSNELASASTTFTITAPNATAAPTETPTGTGTSSTSPTSPPVYYPTNTPVTVSSGVGLSPILIGVVVVAIAFSVFMAVLYSRRGDKQRPSYREESRYEPRPSTPYEKSPPPSAPYQSPAMSAPSTRMPYSTQRATSQQATYASTRINRPPTSYTPTRTYQSSYQPSVNRSQATYTKVCPHCKRPVRDDMNICPYCSRRLR